MEIVPRPEFRDARSIPAKFSKYDPRLPKFNESEVIVNLEACTSVHLPAMLWCAVYFLLARLRGSDCMLLVPDDADLSVRLEELGLFRILRSGSVTVEQQPRVVSASSKILLEMTRFANTTDAEDLTNQIHNSLIDSRQGSANVTHVIYETFSELANNAAEHSFSEIGAFGLVWLDTSDGNGRLVCGVADGGNGIRTSLLQNPLHKGFGQYEWSAMDRATEELVSGTVDSYRGIGLYETVEKMRIPGRKLIIHSGNGIVSKGTKLTTQITSTRLFPGTMVYISIPA